MSAVPASQQQSSGPWQSTALKLTKASYHGLSWLLCSFAHSHIVIGPAAVVFRICGRCLIRIEQVGTLQPASFHSEVLAIYIATSAGAEFPGLWYNMRGTQGPWECGDRYKCSCLAWNMHFCTCFNLKDKSNIEEEDQHVCFQVNCGHCCLCCNRCRGCRSATTQLPDSGRFCTDHFLQSSTCPI